MGPDAVFLQGLAVDKRLDCEIVEEEDVGGEDVNDEIVHAFILLLEIFWPRIYLLAVPLEFNLVVFKPKRKLENKLLVLGLYHCFVFVEWLAGCLSVFAIVSR